MNTIARLDLRIAAIVCTIVGLYDVSYVWSTFVGGPRIGPQLNAADVVYQDFLVFHAAIRAFLEGKLASIYNVEAFSQYESAIYAERFRGAIGYLPFLYPPIWLLMLLPLGALAVDAAYLSFMTVSISIATWLEGRRDPLGWIFVVTSPAAVLVILAGQNTYLSIALLYGGLRLLDRSPVAAGILLGCLSYKPQLWILIPFALLAARQWRALFSMFATIAVLVLASMGVLGVEAWRGFLIAAVEAGPNGVVDEVFQRTFKMMTTLSSAARIVGLPTSVGTGIQIAGAGLALLAVWTAFSRYRDSTVRIAVLVAATFLISPYLLNYDLLILMPALVAMFRRAAVDGFQPHERLVYLAAWMLPILGPAANGVGVPLTPVVILAFGLVAWKRLGSESEVAASAMPGR